MAGRFSDVIRNMREVAPGAPAWLVQALYYALPNFRNFDFKDRSSTAIPCRWRPAGWVTAYAVAYIGVRARLARWPSSGARSCSEGRGCSLLLAGRGSCPWSRTRIDERLGAAPRAGRGPLPLVGRAGAAPVPGLREPGWPTSTGCAPSSTSAASAPSPTDKRFDLLQPLIEITTTLDPAPGDRLSLRRHLPRRAAAAGRGAAPARRSPLLERGARAPPGSWRLRQDLGFFHFFFLRRCAARGADPAGGVDDLPGAAFGCETTAADVPAGAGRAETAAPDVAADLRAVRGADARERAPSTSPTRRLGRSDALHADVRSSPGFGPPPRRARRAPTRRLLRARWPIPPASRSLMIRQRPGVVRAGSLFWRTS